MGTVTLQTRIYPTIPQRELLDKTIDTVLAICNAISPVVFNNRKIGKAKLQDTVYSSIKIAFPGIRSQLIVRSVAKVFNTYRTATKKKTKLFKPICFHGKTIEYDDHILTVKDDFVSIGTLEGRINIPIKRSKFRPFENVNSCCKLQKSRHNNHYYLLFSSDIPNPKPIEYSGYLGVDLGIVNLAVTSDGTVFSGEKTKEVRKRNESFRSRLTSAGTKSAKKHLKRLSGKERRFKKDINHCISKAIVEYAVRHGKAIALEELHGFSRTVNRRKGKALRNVLGKWAFAELRSFIEYKASELGVTVVIVPAYNTSITCPSCGCCDKQNRPTRDKFECISCKYANESDLVSAINIGLRAGALPRLEKAGVTQPIVAGENLVTSLGGSFLPDKPGENLGQAQGLVP